MKKFPNDEDGDVLRSLYKKGVNLDEPRDIEFYCYAENESVALNIAAELEKLGFKSDIFFDEEELSSDKKYSVYNVKNMIPSYEDIVETQSMLNKLLSKFNTRCDGWGTLS